jgi:hypothetical protein
MVNGKVWPYLDLLENSAGAPFSNGTVDLPS